MTAAAGRWSAAQLSHLDMQLAEREQELRQQLEAVLTARYTPQLHLTCHFVLLKTHQQEQGFVVQSAHSCRMSLMHTSLEAMNGGRRAALRCRS